MLMDCFKLDFCLRVCFFLHSYRTSTMGGIIWIFTKFPFILIKRGDLSTPNSSWDITYWVYEWWCSCWLLPMNCFKLVLCLHVHFFLCGFCTSTMDVIIGISIKFPFIPIRQPLKFLWLKRYRYLKIAILKVVYAFILNMSSVVPHAGTDCAVMYILCWSSCRRWIVWSRIGYINWLIDRL